MEIKKKEVWSDSKEDEIAKLEYEIAELERELDMLISCSEGGDHTDTRDLIAKSKKRLCDLRGETFIEAY